MSKNIKSFVDLRMPEYIIQQQGKVQSFVLIRFYLVETLHILQQFLNKRSIDKVSVLIVHYSCYSLYHLHIFFRNVKNLMTVWRKRQLYFCQEIYFLTIWWIASFYWTLHHYPWRFWQHWLGFGYTLTLGLASRTFP